MRHIQFYENKLNNKLDMVLGSDGYLPLDGRKTLNTIINDIESLKSCTKQKEYKHYKIMSGSLMSATTIYSNF